MASAELDAVKRLRDELGAYNKTAGGSGVAADPDASSAGIALLHSSAVPAARVLAPTDFEDGLLSPLIAGCDREALARACQTTMEQLTLGLAQQTITDSTQVQQACELLCALCDVISMAMTATEPSSSRFQEEWTAPFEQLARTGTILQALADATEELNRRVLSRAGEVPEHLLMSATLSCMRLSGCILSWPAETDVQASSQHVSRCYKLIDWAIEKGLVCQLAQASLLVWGLDPAPYTARGPQGLQQLTQLVRMATLLADKLPIVMALTCIHHHDAGGGSLGPMIALGQQGRGSDGTTPAPYLRLTLLQLATAQHFRRSAALPPGSVPNQPKGSRAAIAALRAAVQQQLTPSCASQLLQRLAPSFWEVVGRRPVSAGWRKRATQERKDLCAFTINEWLRFIEKMCREDKSNVNTEYAVGPQELQLVLETTELYAASQEGTSRWESLGCLLQACPYPALVEFNTRHGRTLLTLAERSLEAALALPATASAGRIALVRTSTSTSSSSGRSRDGPSDTASAADMGWEPTASLLTCLSRCLMGGPRATAGTGAAGSSSYEAKDYPAHATWALLDPSTAPRLLRLMEALLRTPGTGDDNWELCRVLPTHLPDMALFYSSPSTARVNMLVECAPQGAGAATAAAAAAVRAAVPGSAGVELLEWIAEPYHVYFQTLLGALRVAEFVGQSLVRPVALLDAESFQWAAAAAAFETPPDRRSRAWLIEKVLLDAQPGDYADEVDLVVDLAPYKARVLHKPQLVASILEQVQQGVKARQEAATARHAAKLAKRQGGGVSVLMEHLQAMQLGSGSSGSPSSAQAGGGGVAAAPSGATQEHACDDSSSSSACMLGSSDADASSAADVPPATSSNTDTSWAGWLPPVMPGDITVAVNALLVACKAAGALLGLPELLEKAVQACQMYGMVDSWYLRLVEDMEYPRRQLSAGVQEVAEWAVLLHPLLAQLLPAEQGQVLAGLRGRLVGSSSSSSSSSSGAARAQGTAPRLSSAEVAAVLGALQHVVIPGQPGCSNPRCCCLDGVSEEEMKTQVCTGCRGARYCSKTCQRAHWGAGHKEVCKAVQAAAQAAAASTEVA